MGFVPIDSMHDSDQMVSPQEKFRALLAQVVKRRKNVSPVPADGFYSETNNSDAEGSSVSTAPGAKGQN